MNRTPNGSTRASLVRLQGRDQYFRNRQPRMLILWGKNDSFFTVEGAEAAKETFRSFALEDFSDFIAARMWQLPS